MTRTFEPLAEIQANADYVWVRTWSDCGLWRPDLAAGTFRFERCVAAGVLGQAILAALAKSREVDTDKLHLLTEGLGLLDRVRLWEREEMAAGGYKTLRAMYKNMMRVSVERDQSVIRFTPMRHDKLQAWEGFASDDADHQPVVVSGNASPEEVGEAASLALSRCTYQLRRLP